MVARGNPKPMNAREPFGPGRPTLVKLGTHEAAAAATEIRDEALRAIRRGESGVRKLAELAHLDGCDLVLRMPEVWDFLDWLKKRGDLQAIKRILGCGRGRPRENRGYLVESMECLMESEGLSAAKAAKILARSFPGSPRTLQNAYAKAREPHHRWRKGLSVPSGQLYVERWTMEKQR